MYAGSSAVLSLDMARNMAYIQGSTDSSVTEFDSYNLVTLTFVFAEYRDDTSWKLTGFTEEKIPIIFSADRYDDSYAEIETSIYF